MTMKGTYTENSFILYLATFPPRECGIATFTHDLSTAFDKRYNPATKSRIIAINEGQTSIYNYNSKVLGQITADNLEHYVSLAEKINRQDEIKLVNIQHEFGIFGGKWGDYLIPLLQVIKKPVFTTFHSVVPDPDIFLKNLVRFVTDKSRAVIVMNERSKHVLETTYQIPKYKIELIPHGIPQTAFESPESYKKQFGFEEKIVLSTFGLLSRDKGVQYAIRALPSVIKRFPQVIYIILGVTHPMVRKSEGESYRNFLSKEVEKAGLKNHVKFYNKYMTLDEIVTYLKATDIYLYTPINLKQSVSGTLSYALGCGRPVIATSTAYAKHLINEDNGRLVPWRDPKAISKALIELLGDEKLRRSLSKTAYENTRKMIWPNVAASYFNVYSKHADLKIEERKLPEIKLDHLMRLTDNFGILHHTRYSKPERRFGYSADDNARALIVCAQYYAQYQKKELLPLLRIYLNFLKFVQRSDGSFANIVTSKKQRDTTREDDVQGRCFWALGFVASRDFLPKEIVEDAEKLLQKSLSFITKIRSPRAAAFTMTGLYYYVKRYPQRKLVSLFKKLADSQVALYKSIASDEWQWFEDFFTYSNSKLPESLFYAYDLLNNKKYLDIALSTLRFLRKITFNPKQYSPIGQKGWYFRYKKRAYYDQQPEDTSSMVQTKFVAFRVTGDNQHLFDAWKAFQWFLGKNHLNQMVYDEVSGGCYDGVGQYSLNLNQGAESTLSYLMARLPFDNPEIIKFL